MNSYGSSIHETCALLRGRHRKSRQFGSVAGMLLLVAVGPAQAQEGREEANSRSGFWLSLGAGSGWNITDAPDIDEDPMGVAAYVRLGGTVSQQVLLSGEVIGRQVTQGDTTVARFNVTLSVLIFPSRTGGFFIKGGIGISSEESAGALLSSNQGLGLTAGAGYDWRVKGNLYVTPNIDWLMQSFPSTAGAGLWTTQRLLLVTVGLTWH